MALALQASHTNESYGDANDSVEPSLATGATGLVPAYAVLDASARWRISARHAVTTGLSSLANARYFTKRTDEYPGPGLLPGLGCSVYVGIAAFLRPGSKQ